ncbi:MAG: Sensor histidine kinase LiaS [Paracidovorax wautersii]|uniref:histidine kinase n=1 Tax=Paracidovorax wautersii TaxID=1177982 RepID=A0A7V8JR60_9BURK|nr:MAG: Sensor histidine kinase LiaS [Paracidovorax wautersii]
MKFIRLPRFYISFPLAVLVIVVLIGISELSYQRSRQALADMSELLDARQSIQDMLRYVLDAEAGQRGYLLTGDKRYLEPYQSATLNIERERQTLHRWLTSHPYEIAQTHEFFSRITRKQLEMEVSLRLHDVGNQVALRSVMDTKVGLERMNAIRAVADAMLRSLDQASNDAQQQVRSTLMMSRGAIALVCLLGLLCIYLYLRQGETLQTINERQQRLLQKERDQLEIQVQRRTHRLAQLATYLQNVREDERARLARELHDELGALLTAAKLDVTRLRNYIGDVNADATQRIHHLVEMLNSGIALKRRIIEDLRPSSLSNLGLAAALEILTREYQDRSGLDVRLSLEPVEGLSANAELTIYRLIQEALTNVSKYAQARRIDIQLRVHTDSVQVLVRDDGSGFNPEDIKPSTHGLDGMRHRVEANGGQLAVRSAPGAGTTIEATLPRQLPPAPGASPAAFDDIGTDAYLILPPFHGHPYKRLTIAIGGGR